jgi:5,10-methenyltetrahydrofolate synthetase
MPQNPGFASPACYAHELDPAYVTGSGLLEVARWRRTERERLIAARLARPAAERARVAAEVARELDRLIDIVPGTVVSAYWPFRGELDLRDWLGRVIERGGRAALPLVTGKGRPLVFREWSPRAPITRAVWNIPVPANGAEIAPNIVIAPLVGHDPECYRLGYGGGFFDRTLAAFPVRPLVVGVGDPGTVMPTIRPQPHDIPMDVIVTGNGQVRWRAG